MNLISFFVYAFYIFSLHRKFVGWFSTGIGHLLRFVQCSWHARFPIFLGESRLGWSMSMGNLEMSIRNALKCLAP